KDDYVCLALGYCGVSIIDVSNPADLAEVGNYDFRTTIENVFFDDNYVYAAASGAALMIIDFTPPTGILEEQLSAAPGSFQLDQNYPNPFNPSTVFPYRLAEPGHVNLTVYDLLGRRVATLIDTWQAPGQHSVTWDPHRGTMQSGVYFYRLVAGNYAEVRKCVLLK
ncbi:MAG: T9SS type A sorting domain-containing protein, partial [Planctomycetes bacterium]|nr:T9SS type A sorting domain-containing protein [Planctomycetota bacterium]